MATAFTSRPLRGTGDRGWWGFGFAASIAGRVGSLMLGRSQDGTSRVWRHARRAGYLYWRQVFPKEKGWQVEDAEGVFSDPRGESSRAVCIAARDHSWFFAAFLGYPDLLFGRVGEDQPRGGDVVGTGPVRDLHGRAFLVSKGRRRRALLLTKPSSLVGNCEGWWCVQPIGH